MWESCLSHCLSDLVAPKRPRPTFGSLRKERRERVPLVPYSSGNKTGGLTEELPDPVSFEDETKFQSVVRRKSEVKRRKECQVVLDSWVLSWIPWSGPHHTRPLRTERKS